MDRPGQLDSSTVERARRDAVEVAEGILSGSVGLLAGCRSLARFGHSLVDDWSVDSDFGLFGAVDSETDHLPLEDQRVHWDPAAFEEKQREVQAYEAKTREQVLKACRSVVTRFGGI